MPATIDQMNRNKPLKRLARRFQLLLAMLLLAWGPVVAGELGTTSAANSRAIAPAVVLAEIYRPEMEPTRYLVSEKFDGVRAIWDGRELKFRSGRRVSAPVWFIAGLPSEPLDGELWLKRGGFDELSGIVRKSQPVDAEWHRVRYMIFELPGAPGTFSERADRIRSILKRQNLGWLQAIEQFRVADRGELAAAFERVVRKGGEGLMLHLADAPYVTGRSDVLLKLKPLQDAEAKVIGHAAGRGRLAGRLGALEVETSDGKRFRVGSGLGDAERRHPPPLGTTITYRYQALTKDGLPRFPRYWRVRQEF